MINAPLTKILTLPDFQHSLEVKINTPNGGRFKQIRSTLNQLVKNGLVSPETFVATFEDRKKLAGEYQKLLRKKKNKDFTSPLSNLNRLINLYHSMQSFGHISDFNVLFRALVIRKFGDLKTKENPGGIITKTEASRKIFDYLDSQHLPLPAGSKGYLSETASKNSKAQTFANWLNGTKPAFNIWREHLLMLDTLFSVPPGTLISKLNTPTIDSSEPSSRTHKRRKNALELPKLANDQFRTYSLLKIDGITIKTVNHLTSSKNKFAEHRISDTTKLKNGWSLNSDGVCTSLNVPLNGLRGYYTYLATASDEKDKYLENYDDLDLSLLADNNLLADYVSYLQKNDFAVQPAINLLRFIDELSRDHGYLRLGIKPLNEMTTDDWFSHLDELLRYIPILKNALDKNTSPPKDNKRAVRFLIEKGTNETYNYLDKMIDIGLQTNSLSKEESHEIDLKWRAVSLILLLSRCTPLRIRNWTQIKVVNAGSSYYQVNCPSLIFNQESSFYRLIVPKKFLKNRNREDINDINMPVPVQFNWLLEEYMQSRVKLIDTHDLVSDNLFFKLHHDDETKKYLAKPYVPSELGSLFKKITKAMISEISPELDHQGINPHALRHLMATLYLNDHPENFLGLATLLNDSLKVVISIYAEIDSERQSNNISNWAAEHYGRNDSDKDD